MWFSFISLVNSNPITLLVFSPTIFLRIINYRARVLKQKMSNKDPNGLINKMGTLITNQSERATKLGQNEFIHELNCDCSLVGP